MTKIGRISPTYQQLCFAHGVQLAVIDVLYSAKDKINTQLEIPETENEMEGEFSDLESLTSEDNENDQEDNNHEEQQFSDNYKPIIDKIRKIVRLFRRSPLKNETLQKHVKSDLGKELTLILDCKTRWNCLAVMLERFYLLRNCVKKALVDVNSELSLDYWELTGTKNLVCALKPIQATVEALCRRDSNLITADATLNFMLNKLSEENSGLSLELIEALRRRISERRTDLSGVLKYLHNGSYEDEDEQDELFGIPRQTKICSIIKDIVSRLSPVLPNSKEQNHHIDEDVPGPGPSVNRKKLTNDLQKDLDQVIKNAMSSNHKMKYQPEKSFITTRKR